MNIYPVMKFSVIQIVLHGIYIIICSLIKIFSKRDMKYIFYLRVKRIVQHNRILSSEIILEYN